MSSTCSHAVGGWLAGCGAATAVIAAVGQTVLMVASRGNLAHFLLGPIVLLIPSAVVFVITCLLTAIPAAVVIWLSEEFRIRSVMFFGCAGAAIGALSISLLVRSPAVWTSGAGGLFLVAGLIAGLTYSFVDREFAAYEQSI